MSVSRSSVT